MALLPGGCSKIPSSVVESGSSVKSMSPSWLRFVSDKNLPYSSLNYQDFPMAEIVLDSIYLLKSYCGSIFRESTMLDIKSSRGGFLAESVNTAVVSCKRCLTGLQLHCFQLSNSTLPLGLKFTGEFLVLTKSEFAFFNALLHLKHFIMRKVKLLVRILSYSNLNQSSLQPDSSLNKIIWFHNII